MSDSLQPHELKSHRFLCPWDSLGKNTGAGYHFLLQGIFPTQGPNLPLLHLLHWQVGSLSLSHLRSPYLTLSLCTCRSLINSLFKSVDFTFSGLEICREGSWGGDEYEVRESKGWLEPMKMNLISCWFLDCFQFQRCGYHAHGFGICVTDTVCDASCLAVFHCVHCLLNPWSTRHEWGTWKKTQGAEEL